MPINLKHKIWFLGGLYAQIKVCSIAQRCPGHGFGAHFLYGTSSTVCTPHQYMVYHAEEQCQTPRAEQESERKNVSAVWFLLILYPVTCRFVDIEIVEDHRCREQIIREIKIMLVSVVPCRVSEAPHKRLWLIFLHISSIISRAAPATPHRLIRKSPSQCFRKHLRSHSSHNRVVVPSNDLPCSLSDRT